MTGFVTICSCICYRTLSGEMSHQADSRICIKQADFFGPESQALFSSACFTAVFHFAVRLLQQEPDLTLNLAIQPDDKQTWISSPTQHYLPSPYRWSSRNLHNSVRSPTKSLKGGLHLDFFICRLPERLNQKDYIGLFPEAGRAAN